MKLLPLVLLSSQDRLRHSRELGLLQRRQGRCLGNSGRRKKGLGGGNDILNISVDIEYFADEWAVHYYSREHQGQREEPAGT